MQVAKTRQKISMGLNIYYIRYVIRNPEWNVNSVNPLYLMINRIDDLLKKKKVINT